MSVRVWEEVQEVPREDRMNRTLKRLIEWLGGWRIPQGEPVEALLFVGGKWVRVWKKEDADHVQLHSE